ncbi:hypothetical protein GQ600_12082 [Phytophthora cactorum]|nr:hypothetical protein GQ600_12082 [Phytophthora cactorum]
MSAEYNALGKDYRARLKSAPDDAQMARLVLEDIREGDGLSGLLEYGQERGVRLTYELGPLHFSSDQCLTVFRVWDAMRQDECKMEPSFCIAALVAEAKLEQSDQITTMGKHQAKLGRVRDVLDYTQAHSTGGATIYQKFLVLLRDSGSRSTIRIVVTAMIKWKKRDLVLKLLDDMDKSNVPLRLFTEVAVTAAPTNQQQLILEILDYIHKHHAAVDFSPVYTSAIRAAFKVNEFDFVLTILRKMKISGLDAVMSLNEAGQYDRLLCVFEEMRECGYFVEKAFTKLLWWQQSTWRNVVSCLRFVVKRSAVT